VGIRLSADWMMIMENEKLKMSEMYYVVLYIREGLKHTGRNCGKTYI
jgi:hypothetical protein